MVGICFLVGASAHKEEKRGRWAVSQATHAGKRGRRRVPCCWLLVLQLFADRDWRMGWRGWRAVEAWRQVETSLLEDVAHAGLGEAREKEVGIFYRIIQYLWL